MCTVSWVMLYGMPAKSSQAGRPEWLEIEWRKNMTSYGFSLTGGANFRKIRDSCKLPHIKQLPIEPETV